MSENPHLPINVDLQHSEANNSTILPRWLVRLCRPTRMMWLAPLLGFVLTIPFFFTGYIADDHIIRQQTIGKSVYFNRPAWDCFNWVSSDREAAVYREKGILMYWWSPDAFRWRMLRPFASLVHAFQFRFFDNSPWVMHVVLGLLYALLIFLCAKLLGRFSTSTAATGIACLLFAVDDGHSWSSGWISSYNTMLCCIFGLCALLMHDRWRRQKSTVGLLFSVSAFILSLLCSEGGLALMGYLFAYALFIECGTWRNKAVTLIPGGIVSMAYLIFYSMHHLGAVGSFGYLSPSDDIVRTIFIILSNTVVYVLSQVLSFPPLSLPLMLTGAWGVAVALILLAGLIYIFKYFLVSNSTVKFFGTGMVLSIIPFTLGFMTGDRLLLWAGPGAAGLLGELFISQAAATGKTQRIFAKGLLVTNTAVSILFFVPLTCFAFTKLEHDIRTYEKTITSEKTVILNGGTIYSFYAPAIRDEKGGKWPEHVYFLYDGPDTITVKRTGEKTLLATTPKGWFSTYMEMSTRPRLLYFKEGETFHQQLMTATIVNVTRDGRPLIVNFTFKKDLSEFVWMKWSKNGPVKCRPPAMGEEIRLFASLF